METACCVGPWIPLPSLATSLLPDASAPAPTKHVSSKALCCRYAATGHARAAKASCKNHNSVQLCPLNFRFSAVRRRCRRQAADNDLKPMPDLKVGRSRQGVSASVLRWKCSMRVLAAEYHPHGFDDDVEIEP